MPNILNILKTLKLKHIFFTNFSIIQNGGCSETQSFQLHLHLRFMQNTFLYSKKYILFSKKISFQCSIFIKIIYFEE